MRGESHTEGWGFPEFTRESLRSAGDIGHSGGLHITRLAPGDHQLGCDWTHQQPEGSVSRYQASWWVRGRDADANTLEIDPAEAGFTIDGLENGIDYEIRLEALGNSPGPATATSPTRLFRTGPVPGVVVNYIHPEDYTYGFSGRSPASPSILRLADGTLLASHDVYWGGADQNLSKIFRSDDGGETWSFVSNLHPCFWGKLFSHRGGLYMFANSTEYGAILIGRSDDSGRTWSSPVTIMAGGNRDIGGPHKGPMPIVAHAGRIWTAVDHGSWSIGGHASGVLSAPVDADLLDSKSWTATPFLAYDSKWPGTIEGGETPHLLEGNVVVTPSGNLVNILRYNTKGGTPDDGRAIILGIDKDDPGAALRFQQVIDMPGNMSKFNIYADPVAGGYWSLVNRVTSTWVNQRNILSLVRSRDLQHWDIKGDVLNYEDNGWPEDTKMVGFQYVDWLIEDEDMLALSRTAIGGAHNYHNANYITFHRIEGFRSW